MAANLEEIFGRCGLKKENLLGEFQREIRNKIALKLTDWKVFGNILLIPKERLASIDAENQTEEQKKIAILDSWHERESKDATSFKLAEKLYEHNRRDLVTDLCNFVIKSQYSVAEPKAIGLSDSRHARVLDSALNTPPTDSAGTAIS